MSYSFSIYGDLIIKKENFPKVAKTLFLSPELTKCSIKENDDFLEQLSKLGWDYILDTEGNLYNLEWNHNPTYSIDLRKFFCLIAPFVESESCLYAIGEDSNRWRLLFKNNTCLEQDNLEVYSEEEMIDRFLIKGYTSNMTLEEVMLAIKLKESII